MEVSGQLHAPAALPPGKSSGTHFIGGWVDPRASLEDLEKRKFFTLPGIELRTIGRPARSQSLSRLSYPGSFGVCVCVCVCVCALVYSLCVFLYLGRGLATGRSLASTP
jgi:hypothetical protein